MPSTKQSTAPYGGPKPPQVVPAKHVDGMPPNNHPEDNTAAYEKGESMAGGESGEIIIEEGEDTLEGGEGEDTGTGEDTTQGGGFFNQGSDTI